MAKKKKPKSKSTGRVKSSKSSASRGRSDDFKPDRELAKRWKENRGGRNLPEGYYQGMIQHATVAQLFTPPRDFFILTVKIDRGPARIGNDHEIPFRLETDVDLRIFGDVLNILGYNADDVELDQLSQLARELTKEKDTICFQAVKSEGKDGRIFTNYRLRREMPEE